MNDESTPDLDDFFSALVREFERLGLDYRDLPGLAIGNSASDAAEFLAQVRRLSPGVTWHDVFPALPTHWVPGAPETWTHPYRPFGPYDYAELPVGPAVQVSWDRTVDRSCLAEFVERSRDAGWPIYGAGFVEIDDPEWPTLNAMIIFDRTAPAATGGDFWAWVDAQGDMSMTWLARTGTEGYAPEP